MEKEQAYPQEKKYRLGELKERESEQERVSEELDALFNHQWHPETLRHLASQFGELHKRFTILIESGEATKEDEKAFIEASYGWRDWRDEKEPFPLEEWREKLRI